MDDRQNSTINWYPGHMAKAKRAIAEALPQIDAVIELADARVPVSSRNPDFASLFKNKPRLLLLTKSDLADEQATKAYIAANRGIAIDCKAGKGLGRVAPALNELLKEKLQRNREKGVVKDIRVMVAGITNVGKSTFINSFSGTKKAKAEDRPGVTRGNQWIPTDKGIMLMDTPGLLWPKFQDPDVAVKLACLGSIRDEILDQLELAVRLIGMLRTDYAALLCGRYRLEEIGVEESDYDIFCRIALKRGFIRSGGIIDEERCAAILLDEFRGGKIGRITLDK